jgi:hypothetical protein
MTYAENLEMLRTYLEWRHKLLIRYGVAIGALVAAAAWLYQSTRLSPFTAVPLFLAAVTSAVVLLYDIAVVNVLQRLTDVGEGIERQLGLPGCCSEVNVWWHSTHISGKVILRWLYVSSTIIFCAIGICTAVLTVK